MAVGTKGVGKIQFQRKIIIICLVTNSNARVACSKGVLSILRHTTGSCLVLKIGWRNVGFWTKLTFNSSPLKKEMRQQRVGEQRLYHVWEVAMGQSFWLTDIHIWSTNLLRLWTTLCHIWCDITSTETTVGEGLHFSHYLMQYPNSSQKISEL